MIAFGMDIENEAWVFARRRDGEQVLYARLPIFSHGVQLVVLLCTLSRRPGVGKQAGDRRSKVILSNGRQLTLTLTLPLNRSGTRMNNSSVAALTRTPL
jgi:hypothetical protein